jgi:thiaminase/transcriptional activator TenA
MAFDPEETMKKLSAELWNENQDLAEACLRSRFVQGIARGDLPRDAFKEYIAQDAYFLEAFARGYAMALALSPDRPSLYTFAELLQGVMTELQLHAGYARRWNVDLSAVTPSSSTSAYTEFLVATARAGALPEICAAMAPCMRLYAWLGRRLADTSLRTAGDYAEWIRTYASSEFDALAQRLEELLDAHAADTVSVRDRYRKAMELELRFFEAHACIEHAATR